MFFDVFTSKLKTLKETLWLDGSRIDTLRNGSRNRKKFERTYRNKSTKNEIHGLGKYIKIKINIFRLCV